MTRRFVMLSVRVACLAGVFGLLGLAQVAAASTVGPITGMVVDAAGKPAAGAKVWLLGTDAYFIGAPRTVAEATTDEKGRFQMPAVKWERSAPTGLPPFLAACDAQGRIGASELQASWWSKNTLPSNCKITLVEGRECEGRMVDAAGKPIAKAAIVPLLWLGGQTTPGGYTILVLPAELQKELTTETDADGRFRFKQFPGSGQVYARIRAGEFGEPLAMWNLGKSITIRLSRPGNLQVAVPCPKDAKAVAGLPLFVMGNIEAAPSEKEAVSLLYFQEVTTQKDGTFLLEKLPPGKYTVQSKFPASLPYCADKDVAAEVKSGETTREKITLKPAVKLQGKVADKATSKGGAGVRLALIDGAAMRDVVTDAQGAFTIYTKPGAMRIFVWQAPEPYVAPGMTGDMTTLNVTEAVTAPPILLDRVMPVEALVVDAAGRPIADAEIRIAVSGSEDASEAFQNVLRSDAAGKVALGNFSSKQTVAIRARTKNASAELKTIVVGKQKEPIRLVLSEKTAFAVHGTLVDDAGAPIPQANVKLLTQIPVPETPPSPNYGSSRSAIAPTSDFSLEECRSDTEGKFTLAGLWTDVRYRLLIKIPGHERYASAMIRAAEGKSHDFGKIVLARTVEVVEGTVMDTAGKPIAGAKVFNSGDGPEPIETRSDAAGRFRLEGFRKGPAYVFAVKDGYRFAGGRTTAGATDTTIKMLRNDEAAPKRPVAAETIPPEEQKKLARALLEKAWDAVKSKKRSVLASVGRALLQGIYRGDDGNRQRDAILALMGKIDAEQARRWASEPSAKSSAKSPSAYSPQKNDDEDSSENSIQKAAEEDIDEAMSMLPKDAEQGVRQLRALAAHFAETDRAKALRCAEEGIVRARSLDQPSRTTELARWGETVTRLGNKEAGRKLVEEAADTADRWKPNGRYDQAYGAIAEAVAPHDAARAIALLKKISNQYYQQRYRMQVATALDDLKQVEALLKDADPETIKSIRVRWAYRIAATRPAEAVRAVEALLKRDATEDATPHLAKLAELIGTHDSALTCSLIDRSLAAFLQSAKDSDDSADGRSAQAARLAVVARKVGYADMEGVVLHVLALRPTPGKSDSPIPAMEAAVKTARILALTDPAAARQVLQTLEPAAETIENRDGWFQAWALADPRHAAVLAEQELARVKSGSAAADSLDAVLAAVRLWTITPDEQIQEILPDYGKNTETRSRAYPYDFEVE